MRLYYETVAGIGYDIQSGLKVGTVRWWKFILMGKFI